MKQQQQQQLLLQLLLMQLLQLHACVSPVSLFFGFPACQVAGKSPERCCYCC